MQNGASATLVPTSGEIFHRDAGIYDRIRHCNEVAFEILDAGPSKNCTVDLTILSTLNSIPYKLFAEDNERDNVAIGDTLFPCKGIPRY